MFKAWSYLSLTLLRQQLWFFFQFLLVILAICLPFIIFSSVNVAELSLSGKELLTRISLLAYCSMPFCVSVYFPFGFEGRILVLIV